MSSSLPEVCYDIFARGSGLLGAVSDLSQAYSGFSEASPGLLEASQVLLDNGPDRGRRPKEHRVVNFVYTSVYLSVCFSPLGWFRLLSGWPRLLKGWFRLHRGWLRLGKSSLRLAKAIKRLA